MKRVLVAVAAAVLFLSTLAVPTPARADDPSGQCNGTVCKP